MGGGGPEPRSTPQLECGSSGRRSPRRSCKDPRPPSPARGRRRDPRRRRHPSRCSRPGTRDQPADADHRTRPHWVLPRRSADQTSGAEGSHQQTALGLRSQRDESLSLEDGSPSAGEPRDLDAIPFAYLPQDPGRHTGRYDSRRKVPADHSACPHDGILADADSGADDGPAAQPDVVGDVIDCPYSQPMRRGSGSRGWPP